MNVKSFTILGKELLMFLFLLWMGCGSVFAQSQTIIGKVSDGKGEPLPRGDRSAKRHHYRNYH